MTPEEAAVYATGAAALLSCIPWLRVLRARMELTRARIFLRWRPYTRALRLGAVALAAFLAAIAASVVLEPEEVTLRAFMPVGLFLLLVHVGTIYISWVLLDIARGPGRGGSGILLLTPGLGMKGLLLATGLPAIAVILRTALLVPYHSEAMKARFFLHFARTHRAHQRLVLLVAAGILANLAYTAWNPLYLHERAVLLPALPTYVGVLLIHLGFIGFGAFITWTMGGASLPRKKVKG